MSNGRAVCPRCEKGDLERVRAPEWLRILRMIPGLNPRMYRCDMCLRSDIRWRD